MVDLSSFPKELEPFDYMMLRSEDDPRARSGFLAVSILESVPDFEQLRDVYDRAARAVIRLRQKVVVPTIPLVPPQWVVDPDFELDFHVRRVVLPAPGALRDLLDLAQPILAAPFDRARPLWELYLVEGLTEEGAAAVLLKTHHAVMDGMAAVELFKQVFDFDPESGPRPMPPLPVPEETSSNDLALAGLVRLSVTAPLVLARRATDAVRLAGRVASRPGPAIGDFAKTLQSAQRIMGPPPAPPSPLLRRRGVGRRFEVVDFPLDRLRRAAKAAGGSINDAYLAGVCGVLRRYHEALGVPVDTLPLAMPISTRTDDDPAGGNRFAGARIPAPVGEPDPARRIGLIREMVLSARSEPAMTALNGLMPIMTILPTSILNAMAAQAAAIDVQASNVPGYPQPIYLAGVRVHRAFGFGPVPGVAMMITMTTIEGRCEVGINFDTAAVEEWDVFARCLQEGFEEVLASGDGTRGRKKPRKAQSRARTKTTEARPPALRLPGSVAELDASPEGPAIGAFFDLDGTLIAGYSARYLAADRMRRRELSLGEVMRTLAVAVGAGVGRAGFEDVLKVGAEAWRGRAHEDLEEMGERLFRQKIQSLMFPEMQAIVEAHQRRGHTVVLSSSATSYQVEPVARFLGIDLVLCNRFTTEDGLLTGEVEMPVLWGAGKADAVQKLAGELGVDLARSYFYADGDEDLALMGMVGHPRPINPGRKLAAVAKRRGWPTLRLTGKGARASA